jgi:predicted dehydrogenase
VDGVLITASASGDEIIHQAAQMCRKRGRIVLVGQVGLNLRRADFYEKELSFQVSCSYGPGRYDPVYEDQGRDYPLPYVRWTVARNFQAVLEAMAQGTLDVQPLISCTIPHAEAPRAYDLVLNDNRILGVVLTYPDQAPPAQRTTRTRPGLPRVSTPVRPVVGVIGSGNFTRMVLLPAIRAAGATLYGVASAGGVTALHAARKFEAEQATTDYRLLLANPDVTAVFITTRHSSHPQIAAEALEAGKHVFVEKPLAIDEEGLARVRAAHEAHPERQLMVGFNRRFAPHALRLQQALAGRSQPVAISMLVNAGELPADHWQHDPAVGGGRVVGEGCHFIDLALFLVGHPITGVAAVMFGTPAGGVRDDKTSISLTFADGSIATLHYWANGSRSFPKERIEVFSEGRVAVIDNWRRILAYGWPGLSRMRIRQDKGHRREVSLFLERVREGGPPLIPFEQIEQVTRASLAAVRSAREGLIVKMEQ